MPPKQVILTETEWQHIYQLVEESRDNGLDIMARGEHNDFCEVITELETGILKKFDATPDYIEPRHCIDCGRDDYHGFVVEHHVWVALRLHPITNICMDCVQKRLGRPLDFDKDLRLCNGNFLYVPGYDNKERMRRNMLQDGTPEDSPIFKQIMSLYDEDGKPRMVKL